MKKTDFFITVRDNGKTTTRKVTGYYEYMAGLPIGLHKVAERAWVATELSTGLPVTVYGDNTNRTFVIFPEKKGGR